MTTADGGNNGYFFYPLIFLSVVVFTANKKACSDFAEVQTGLRISG
jgi:hypothetical protein